MGPLYMQSAEVIRRGCVCSHANHMLDRIRMGDL